MAKTRMRSLQYWYPQNLRSARKKGESLNSCACMLSYLSPVLHFATHQAPRLLCPWDSPSKNTGVGCHALLQGIFLTQGSDPRFLVSCIGREVLYHQHHLGSPTNLWKNTKNHGPWVETQMTTISQEQQWEEPGGQAFKARGNIALPWLSSGKESILSRRGRRLDPQSENQGFPGGKVVKNPLANTGDIRDAGSIPGSGRSPGGGHGKPLQYYRASLVAQVVKNLPAIQETWI